MGNDEFFEDEEIVLVDEEGVEHTFVLVDVVMVDDTRYALLEPTEGEGDEGAYLFRIDDESGEERLVVVEDDAEFDRVVAVLEEFDETDDDHVHGPGCGHHHEHGPNCNHDHGED